jgi:3-deoxy-D-manno-octulosonate 8-phosphate phosphatase (KDO 8-P phosphatase)
VNEKDLGARLSRVRLAVFDVDGVFTDGLFYLSDDGSETKAFHTQDGYGIRMLIKAGFDVAVISGRTSPAAQRRMTELGVEHAYFACKDKVATFDALAAKLGVSRSETLYAGDDIPDAGLMQAVGVAVAVANAVPAIKQLAAFVTARAGGSGAVREICELLLDARNSAGT